MSSLPSATDPAASPRRGFTLVELMISVFMVAVCVLILGRMAIWQLAEQRRLLRRSVALEVADNTLGRLRALPWEQLAAPMEQRQAVPDHAAELLAGGAVHVRVSAFDGAPLPCRRIDVAVRWAVRGREPESVALTAFRCPRELLPAEAEP